jgi:RHS repeat-associated protein
VILDISMPGAGGLAMSRDGALAFYHADGLGSITSLTDATGSAVAAYTRDAFGSSLQTAGSITNPFRYTGREWDAETGLYYYRARYYDPQIGRFISEDPIGLNGGLDLYAYVGNSPTNFDDPSGLYPGQLPPPPPGYNPSTWKTGQWDSEAWFVKDPDGNVWTAHPEDPSHWRHWDKQGSNGGGQTRWPPNSKKPRPNQKKLPPDRCQTDPNGNAPEWHPRSMWSPLIPFLPFPEAVPQFGIAPLRLPILEWGFAL